jgi:hypothetical protein
VEKAVEILYPVPSHSNKQWEWSRITGFVLVNFNGRVDVGDARTLDASHLSRRGPQDLRIIVERWLITGNGIEQLLLRSSN